MSGVARILLMPIAAESTRSNWQWSSAYLKVSPPRENVLFVPSRNVLLTRSGWGGDRPGSSDHDPAGARPAGSTQEGSAGETTMKTAFKTGFQGRRGTGPLAFT